MHVDGDECLIFGPLHLGELLGRLVNEEVEHLQKLLVGVGHHFLVCASVVEGVLRVPSPDHLDAQQAHLETWPWGFGGCVTVNGSFTLYH